MEFHEKLQELRKSKGLTQEVVAAHLEPLDDIFGRGARREEEHRCRAPLFAQALDHRETIQPGHHDIADDDIIRAFMCPCIPLLAIVGRRDLEVAPTKRVAEDLGQDALILDQQQCNLFSHLQEFSG